MSQDSFYDDTEIPVTVNSRKRPLASSSSESSVSEPMFKRSSWRGFELSSSERTSAPPSSDINNNNPPDLSITAAWDKFNNGDWRKKQKNQKEKIMSTVVQVKIFNIEDPKFYRACANRRCKGKIDVDKQKAIEFVCTNNKCKSTKFTWDFRLNVWIKDINGNMRKVVFWDNMARALFGNGKIRISELEGMKRGFKNIDRFKNLLVNHMTEFEQLAVEIRDEKKYGYPWKAKRWIGKRNGPNRSGNV